MSDEPGQEPVVEPETGTETSTEALTEAFGEPPTPEFVPDPRVSKANQEAARYRTELRATQERLKELERAQMSELERARAERDEATQQAAQLRAEREIEALRAATAVAASRLNLHDPEDALRLIGADVAPENVEAELAALIERKPSLARQATPAKPSAGATPGHTASQPPPQRQETLEERRRRIYSGGRPNAGNALDPDTAIRSGGGVHYNGRDLIQGMSSKPNLDHRAEADDTPGVYVPPSAEERQAALRERTGN